MDVLEPSAGDGRLIKRIAALDRLAFPTGNSRWSTDEITALANDTQHCVALDGTHNAFAICRCVLDEAELLTIGTDPAARRSGLATRLLDHLERWARTNGARTMFLEVAATNEAARTLYLRRGYRQVGTRAGYYRIGAERVDALVLRTDLSVVQNH